ncbi:hypothetical protein SAMN04490240_4109 [Rhodococcus pyridinivorans]|uniref:hypothetical protein n=1 Tax=Rhodococcus pyridinivorans TaxID=103816 RepID=UPI0007CD9A69|nr:hypothetical protein [Rhodococcus pyridinivorans]SED52656.1 hypothetical protein SAMN04490240_4109 [Rhodococcus pyridinivorans]
MSIRDDLVDLIVQADADVDERSFPDRIIDAILARYAVVELPALSEPDDDGQIYTYVADLRIDTSGPGGNEVFLPGGHRISPSWLRQEAADYLAAANRAEAADVDL